MAASPPVESSALSSLAASSRPSGSPSITRASATRFACAESGWNSTSRTRGSSSPRTAGWIAASRNNDAEQAGYPGPPQARLHDSSPREHRAEGRISFDPAHCRSRFRPAIIIQGKAAPAGLTVSATPFKDGGRVSRSSGDRSVLVPYRRSTRPNLPCPGTAWREDRRCVCRGLV